MMFLPRLGYPRSSKSPSHERRPSVEGPASAKVMQRRRSLSSTSDNSGLSLQRSGSSGQDSAMKSQAGASADDALLGDVLATHRLAPVLLGSDGVVYELAALSQKLDDMASHIVRCLDDTSHIRCLAERWPCEASSAGASSPRPLQQNLAALATQGSTLQPLEVNAGPHDPEVPDPSSAHSIFARGATLQPQDVNAGKVEEEIPDLQACLGTSGDDTTNDYGHGRSIPQGAPPQLQISRSFSDIVSEHEDKYGDKHSAMDPDPAGTLEQRHSASSEMRGARSGSFCSRSSSFCSEGRLAKELTSAVARVRRRSDLAKTTWIFLEDPDRVPGGRVVMSAISAAILISAFIPIFQSIEPPPLDVSYVSMVEVAFDTIFALEVVVRFMTCPNRLSFCCSLFNVIDIAAGLLVLVLRSVYTSSLVEAESRGKFVVSTLICAVPILRLLKLLRRFETFHLILKAFRMAMEALPVLLYILAVIVTVFAVMLFTVEPRDNIDTLPRALWLTIVTVGTIGYGDIVPVSPLGGVVAAILIIVSALYMAIPIGIVGSAFSTVWEDRDRLLLVYRARMRFLESGYKAEDIPAMFYNFDTDGDGELTLQEFVSMMSELQVGLEGDRLVQLFSTFDVDSSGTIDDKEFVRTLFPKAFAEIYGQ